MEDKRKNNAWLPFWIFAAVAIGVLLGYAIQNYRSGQSGFKVGSGLSDVDQVLMYIQDRYVDSVDVENLEDDAIIQTLKELDPHSIYLTKENVSRENEQMDGEYEGIGIEFFIVDDTITVVTAMSGGPSESVGIRPGDKIVTVNDSIVAGKEITNTDVVKLLKGKKGTKVNVGIKRGQQKKLLDFQIERAPIAINSVDVAYMIQDSTGFIKINRFSKETYKEFKIALDKLVKQGMSSLIIDLRDNGGGIMIDAIEILDELLDDEKLLLSAEGRRYPREEYHAIDDGDFEKGKLAILINEGSASASEIVAGAIQDWDRGLIIGRRSFGKGLVQQPYQLNDGSAVLLTVARYYTPSGRSIQRPYDEGVDKYYENYSQRNGELFIKDSIKIDSTNIKYSLVNHREVYGGGGIVPDLFVPIDTTGLTNFSKTIYSQGLLQQFVYDYFSEHESEFKGFTNIAEYEDRYFISNTLYQDFVRFVEKDQDKSFTKIETQGPRRSITRDMKALFAKQLFGEDGFYRVENEYDVMITEALKALNEETYDKLLEYTQ